MSEPAVRIVPEPAVPEAGDRVRVVLEGDVVEVERALRRYIEMAPDNDPMSSRWQVPIYGPLVKQVDILAKPRCEATLGYANKSGLGFNQPCELNRTHDGPHHSGDYTWTAQ